MRRGGLLGPALALALAACGGEEKPSAGPKAAGEVAVGLGRDTAPWSDDPAGAAWDACAWIPNGERIDAWVFDLAAARASVAGRGASSLRSEGVEARRTWVRTLGLPEAALVRVVAVRDPSHCFVCETNASDDELAKAMLAHGLVEGDAHEFAREFRQPDGDGPVAVLVQRRVVIAYDRAVFAAVLAVRRGDSPSARDGAGVRAACAAAPKGQPAQIEAGTALRRRRPSDPPAPLASVGVQDAGVRMHEVHVLSCASEAARDETRRFLQRIMAMRPDARPDDVVIVGERGLVLRITLERAHAADLHDARRATQDALTALGSALDSYRGRRGALPTAAEGLRALEAESDVLDEVLGVVPADPWGRPYAYQPAHPRRPDGFVLRSLGPDGEIDTEDDVLPPERER